MKKQRKVVVEAAGGVVFRRVPDGQVEVAVIHRPRYDDWTLPKGKLEKGETRHVAAVREVEEETGLRVRRFDEWMQTGYRDRRGQNKIVTYYFMTPIGGEFHPNDEVDEMRWLRLEDAVALLTHERDREMLAAVLPHAPPL
jgi:8-oxo-dGTP pyrophosphatase MutT (NUDIX family)